MEDNKVKSLVAKKKLKEKIKKEYILLAIIIILLVMIDQISKIIVLGNDNIELIPKVLTLKVTRNNEAAYGIGSNSIISYVITNLIILGVIFKFITTQNEFVDRKTKVFLSLILSGGISNVIDKVVKGNVIEFLDFKQIINIPVFNFADIYILIGWISIAAIFAVFTVEEWRKK